VVARIIGNNQGVAVPEKGIDEELTIRTKKNHIRKRIFFKTDLGWVKREILKRKHKEMPLKGPKRYPSRAALISK